MRISKLTVAGFRSFTKRTEFDLDADVVLLSGPNGTGKTSLVDAVMWGLFGHIPRLTKKDEAVISAYSKDGTARVGITLRMVDAQAIVINRGFDGQRMTLSISNGSDEWQQDEAEEKLMELMKARRDGERSSRLKYAAHQFTRSNYLQQDVVRQFLDESEAERFEAITELVGSGRAIELQRALESSRNAWSRVRTQRGNDLKEREAEYRQLSNRINKLPEEGPEISAIEERWKAWIDACRESELVETISSFDVDWADAESITDRVSRDLWDKRKIIDNSLRVLSDCLHGFEQFNTNRGHSIEELRLSHAELGEKLTIQKEALDRLRTEIRRKRDQLQEIQDTQDQLAALAKLALKHLGDQCPVCDQEIEIDSTRKRLEKIIAVTVDPPKGIEQLEEDAKRSVVTIEELEARVRKSQQELDVADQAQRSNANWRKMIVRQLSEIGIGIDEKESQSSLRMTIEKNNSLFSQSRQKLIRLLEEGEKLSAEITRVSEYLTRKELEAAWRESESRLESLREEQEAYTRTYDESTEIIEALRHASVDLQMTKIKQIEPILSRIYRRIDPHPSFTGVRLITSIVRGKGQTRIVVEDPKYDTVEKQEPTLIFSSSQLNALAVAIFLAFNLGDKQLPIPTAILDDPLQSLDDLNLLGLIDVLRQVKQSRQLFITTHDQRFSRLLARKLRPISENQRLIEIEFSSWSREGPRVRHADIYGRTGPLSVLESVA